MIGMVVSEQDIAGKNMLNSFETRDYDNSKYELKVIPQDIIYPEKIDDWGFEFCVFASRHRSRAGTPSLTVHSTGNFGKADYGGEERTLQNTLANAKHNIYQELRECSLDYEVTLEVTHHGPTNFETPLFFVEIGSSETQWRDEEAAEFVVDCILSGLQSKKKHQTAIGFGGGHYAPKFSEMESVAFSHICPKYAADDLTEDLIKQMIDKTADGVDFAVLDEKGLKGRHKVLIKRVLDGLELEY